MLHRNPKYWVGAMVAHILVLLVWLGYGLGLVRVKGRANAVEFVKTGNVVLVSNHPSFLETVVIPAMFWYGKLTRPYSVTDENFFGGQEWLQVGSNCILVSRDGNRKASVQNGRAVMMIKKYLENGSVIVYYPEGGRTCKGELYLTFEDRAVRWCDSTILNRATNTETVVIPVWVNHGELNEPVGFFEGCLRLCRGIKFQVIFGQPTMLSSEEVIPQWLADFILKAGGE